MKRLKLITALSWYWMVVIAAIPFMLIESVILGLAKGIHTFSSSAISHYLDLKIKMQE